MEKKRTEGLGLSESKEDGRDNPYAECAKGEGKGTKDQWGIGHGCSDPQ